MEGLPLSATRGLIGVTCSRRKIGNSNRKLNFANLEFPLAIRKISVFEKQNDGISINVFGYENKNIVGPLYLTKMEKNLQVNLLLLNERMEAHYILITNIQRYHNKIHTLILKIY